MFALTSLSAPPITPARAIGPRGSAITISGFSGSENLVTFTGLSGALPNSFTVGYATFTNTPSFTFQAGPTFGDFNNIPGSSGGYMGYGQCVKANKDLLVKAHLHTIYT